MTAELIQPIIPADIQEPVLIEYRSMNVAVMLSAWLCSLRYRVLSVIRKVLESQDWSLCLFWCCQVTQLHLSLQVNSSFLLQNTSKSFGNKAGVGISSGQMHHLGSLWTDWAMTGLLSKAASFQEQISSHKPCTGLSLHNLSATLWHASDSSHRQ